MANSAWLKVATAARHADISTDTLRRWFDLGLDHHKVRGTVLVARTDLDDFIRGHRQAGLGMSRPRA